MGRDIRLSLRELVPQTLSRTRGREAFAAVKQKATAARAGRVYLDMSTDSHVGTSFIDELVLEASEMECQGGPELVFVLPGPEMLEKFQKSATWRQLIVRYRQRDNDAIKLIQPAEEPSRLPVRKTAAKPGSQTAT